MSQPSLTILLAVGQGADTGFVEDFLTEAGGGRFHVMVAKSTDAIAERLRVMRADVVLLDHTLSGAETVAVDEAIAAARGVPVLVLGTLDDPGAAEAAVAAGAHDYLVIGRDDASAILRALHYAVERAAALEALNGVAAVHDGRTAEAAAPTGTDRAAIYRGILGGASQQRQAEEAMHLAAALIEATSEAVMVTDPRNVIVAVNPAFTRITGYAAAEVVGRDPRLLNSGRHDGAFYRAMWRALSATGRWQGEVWNRRKNGEVFPEWLSIAVLKNPQGEVTRYVAVFSDISRRKNDEAAIRRLSNFDPLTGLPNRTLLHDRLAQATAQGRRAGRAVAVLMVDVDGLRHVNDAFGHAAGDRLLEETARRLAAAVRDGDTVARIGGDEFVIVLPEAAGERAAATVARKALRSVAEPLVIDGHEMRVTASVGIALFPGDGDDPAILLRNAEAAMRKAHAQGRNTHQFFTPEMNADALRRVRIENALRGALANRELAIHYQPLVAQASRAVVGAEALLRWHNPEHGQVPPDQFVPLAEETGLIIEIGEWVLRTACAETKGWLDEGLGPLKVAVNVSGRQFASPAFARTVAAVLAETGLPPACLELEITETLLMENVAATQAALGELTRLGVSLSIDDFGTGYSSLSYLKSFPIHTLKIDRSFVRDVATDQGGAAITSAIIAMAHTLDRKVIGEGVETVDQFRFLQQAGCDTIQGYLFGRPVPPDKFRQLYLADRIPEAAEAPLAARWAVGQGAGTASERCRPTVPVPLPA
jgi:diguanylate cyclase (GGDEF)-like protein/PAS domain S-box-containing protein